MKVKKTVYARAKGKCEKCGRSLGMKYGDFHHTRNPATVPRAQSVRFLCPTCHRMYGHRRVTRNGDWGDKKVGVARNSVVKLPIDRKKDLLKKLSSKQLRLLAQKHRVTVRGKTESNFLGDYRTSPSKRQYINALSKLSKSEIRSGAKKKLAQAKKRRKRRSSSW